MADGDELLTTRQVAEAFRVKRGSVSRWVKDGRLGAVRTPGGRLRIRRSDVEAFLAQTVAGDTAGDDKAGAA